MRKLHCPVTKKAFWWSNRIGKALLTKHMLGVKGPYTLKEPAVEPLHSSGDVLNYDGYTFSCYYDIQEDEFLVFVEKHK